MRRVGRGNDGEKEEEEGEEMRGRKLEEVRGRRKRKKGR